MADTDKKFLDEDGVSQFAEETKKYVDKHADNDDIHVTPSDKTNWDGKADDDGVVHTTGDETIDGNKTFTGTTSGTLFSGNFECNEKESYYGADYFYALDINDGKARVYSKSDSSENTLTMSVLSDDKSTGTNLAISVSPTGTDSYIQWTGRIKNNAIPSQDDYYTLGSSYFAWKNLYVKQINDKDIAYASDIPDVSEFAIDADVVHKKGAEEIGGTKTFTGTVVHRDSTQKIKMENTYIDYDVPLAANRTSSVEFYDKNQKNMARLILQREPNGINSFGLSAYNRNDGGEELSRRVALYLDKDYSSYFSPNVNNQIGLGSSSYHWKNIYVNLVNDKTPAYADDLAGYAAKVHTHTKSDITDFPTIPTKTSQLTNDSGFLTSVAWNSITGKPSSFTPSSHTHDDRYYTESEINTKLSGKSDTTHNHNSVYLGINAKASSASSADNANYATTAGNGVESSGTNYIRYKDGTQICWGEDVDSNTITFPMPFINNKYSCHVNHTSTSTNIAYGFAQRTTTKAFVTASAASSYNCFCYVAIGKWK